MVRQRGTSRKPRTKTPAEPEVKHEDSKALVVAEPKETRVVLNPETGETETIQKYSPYPQEIRYVAKMMYISGQARPADIARRLDIPIGTIRSWQTRDRWAFLKRQVTRLASKDAVKAARKSMGKYIRDIDSGLNALLTRLNTRLDSVVPEDFVKDEKSILHLILEVWRLKIAVFRSLTYGTQGKVFYPHPAHLRFDGTTDDEAANKVLFGQTELDKILEAIPEYMKGAAKLVTGVSPEDIDDEDVYDALVMYLDELEDKREQDKTERRNRKKRVSEEDEDDLGLGIDPVEELLENDNEEEE